MANRKRIAYDLKNLVTDKTLVGISLVDQDCSNMSNFQAVIKGPTGTPYEGGKFVVDVTVGERYPFQPPSAKFHTKIWHPNVQKETGLICLDVLTHKWRSGMTLGTAFISIQGLLETPEPKDPLNSAAGTQMVKEEGLFKKTALMWTHVLAEGPKYDDELLSKLNALKEMGIGESDYHRLCLLTSNGWEVEQAIESFMSPPVDEDDDYPLPQ